MIKAKVPNKKRKILWNITGSNLPLAIRKKYNIKSNQVISLSTFLEEKIEVLATQENEIEDVNESIKKGLMQAKERLQGKRKLNNAWDVINAL